MPLAEAVARVRKGEIVDGKTVIALLALEAGMGKQEEAGP